jgi:serine/threonine protein kinase
VILEHLCHSGQTIDHAPSADDKYVPAESQLRYRILRLHARGGLGEVYVAKDNELNREVALKEIQPSKDRSENRARFVLEAEITGGLEHPGIMPTAGHFTPCVSSKATILAMQSNGFTPKPTHCKA